MRAAPLAKAPLAKVVPAAKAISAVVVAVVVVAAAAARVAPAPPGWRVLLPRKGPKAAFPAVKQSKVPKAVALSRARTRLAFPRSMAQLVRGVATTGRTGRTGPIELRVVSGRRRSNARRATAAIGRSTTARVTRLARTARATTVRAATRRTWR